MKFRSDYTTITIDEVKEQLHLFNEKTYAMSDESLRNHHKSCEQTEKWLLWHDHSSLSGSCLMLFLVRELFDPAIHLSSKEYKGKTGEYIDTQAITETPQLYLMGPSGSKDSEQLAFVPTRRECDFPNRSHI